MKILHYYSNYSGTECYVNQMIPLNISRHLIYPPQILLSNNNAFDDVQKQCAVWKRGAFHEYVPMSTKLLKVRAKSYSENYSFVDERWTYVGNSQSNSTHIPWMDSKQFRKHLSGAYLLFQGDSMVRQIFSRIVSHVRGYSLLTERIFHRNAIYTFNASHDILSIGEKEVGIAHVLSTVTLTCLI